MINNIIKIGLIIIIVLCFLAFVVVIISLWNVPLAQSMFPFLVISEEFPSKVMAGFTAALTWATLLLGFFAFLTIRNSKDQRLDSFRPLLVPIGGSHGIGYIKYSESGSTSFLVENMLHIHNIGSGPAENIAIRLELRSKEGSPTVQLDEMLTFVEPLATGYKGPVRQWKTFEKAVEICDDHWVVISYDDLFHRHFETEARYIKESGSWVSIRTVQSKKTSPAWKGCGLLRRSLWR
jgi:hypothetical protein